MEVTNTQKLVFTIFFFIGLIIYSVTLSGATCSFSNNSGGNWSDPNNWDCGQVPTSADEVIINISSSATVTIDAGFAAVAQNVRVQRGNLTIEGSLTCTGSYFNGSRIELQNGEIQIGSSGSLVVGDAFTGIFIDTGPSDDFINQGGITIQNISGDFARGIALNSLDNFNNEGSITIDGVLGNSSDGVILQDGQFDNSGTILIQNCSDKGILGQSTDLNNKSGGSIRILNTGVSFEFRSGAVVNEDCAFWQVDDIITIDSDLFTNEGIFESIYQGTFPDLNSSRTVFLNDGIITDFYNSFVGVDGFVNNGTIFPGFTPDPCFQEVFTNVTLEGPGADGHLIKNWYVDSNLTILAGIHDDNQNTFTPNSAATGASPLYADVQNIRGTCVVEDFVVPININIVQFITITFPTLGLICPGSSVAIDVSVSGGNTSQSDYTYAWSVNSGEGSLSDLTIQDPIYTAPNTLGNYTLTLMVTDNDGCFNVQTFQVTVDDQPPLAQCQNLSITLDVAGNATITPAQVDNRSTDDCAIQSLSLDRTSFDLQDLGTSQIVNLTVTDSRGNSDMCQAEITVNPSINNTIFNGGDSDGFTSNAYAQPITNNIYAGGNADGFSTVTFAQPITNDIFEGGDGDGFSTITIAQPINNGIFAGGSGDGFDQRTFQIRFNPLQVTVLLQGVYNQDLGAMRTDLTTLPDFPMTEPYSGLGYTLQNAGARTTSDILTDFLVTDWVMVELRDTPENVVAARAVLLSNKGKILEADGAQEIRFRDLPDDTPFHIVIRHRNHLGVMSQRTFEIPRF